MSGPDEERGTLRELLPGAEVRVGEVLDQLPATIGIFTGPDLVVVYANPLYAALAAERPLLGRPVAEVFVVDPMLATGGSATQAIARLKRAGARRIRFTCLVAAPEGVAALREAHPDVDIVTAAVDRCLDGNGYIRPGLGDAGDRIFGTDR